MPARSRASKKRPAKDVRDEPEGMVEFGGQSSVRASTVAGGAPAAGVPSMSEAEPSVGHRPARKQAHVRAAAPLAPPPASLPAVRQPMPAPGATFPVAEFVNVGELDAANAMKVGEPASMKTVYLSRHLAQCL